MFFAIIFNARDQAEVLVSSLGFIIFLHLPT